MEQLIEQLKKILGTNFVLYFKSHSFHWNVEGPDFAQYHDFLGDFYNSVWSQTDDIAEKIRMLDGYAPTSVGRMLELSAIEEMTAIPTALVMFSELKRSNETMIAELRVGIEVAEAAGEPAISNFLQDLLDKHQKKNWMLRSLIK